MSEAEIRAVNSAFEQASIEGDADTAVVRKVKNAIALAPVLDEGDIGMSCCCCAH